MIVNMIGWSSLGNSNLEGERIRKRKRYGAEIKIFIVMGDKWGIENRKIKTADV